MPEVAEKRVSIVLRGSFNPAIVQPWWLVQKDLINETDIETVDLKLIASEFTQFTVGEKFRLTSSADRFELITSLLPFVSIADIVVRIFKEFLPETPVRSFGINVHTLLDVGGWQARDRMGRALAPIAPWGDWGAQLPDESPEKNGGMTDLVMRQTFLEDRESGYIQARVTPFELHQVKMDVNNHFDFESQWESKSRLTGNDAAEIISDRFDDALGQCDYVVRQMLNFAGSVGGSA